MKHDRGKLATRNSLLDARKHRDVISGSTPEPRQLWHQKIDYCLKVVATTRAARALMPHSGNGPSWRSKNVLVARGKLNSRSSICFALRGSDWQTPFRHPSPSFRSHSRGDRRERAFGQRAEGGTVR